MRFHFRLAPTASERGSALVAIGLLVSAFSLLPSGAWGFDLDLPKGGAGYKFLKLPLSPRIVALGGAGAALADQAGDIDLNPAAAVSDSAQLALGRGYPYSEFQSAASHVIWSVPVRSYRILVNARYLGFDNLTGLDGNAQPTTAYGAHTLKAQLGAAGSYREISWGATVNYAENNIAEANYGTVAVNAGLRYRLLPGLYAGASVLNADLWRSDAVESGNPAPVPPTAVQAGVSYTRAIGSQFDAALAVDARKRNDENPAWPVGTELSWRKLIFVRAGWPFGEDEPGLALGLGLHWAAFRFDYAYLGHATLSAGHFWSLQIAY